MARDETNRIYTLSEKDLSDSWVGKGSFNKKNKEKEVMYICPECGHHAFALCPTSGWFHCWACDVWGQTLEGQEASRRKWETKNGPGSAPPVDPAQLRKPASMPHENSGSAQETILEDYVELDRETLDSIEDISLEETVSGNQLQVRRYLEHEQIPLEWAYKMRWGVSSRHIKVKGEETGKVRACLVYRNYVDGLCCNAKFRAVTAVAKTQPGDAATGQHRRTVFEKGFDQVSAVTPCAPYNIDSIRQSCQTLYITEGEKDCLTLCMLGFQHVVSAASGAQTDHRKSFEAFREWLRPVQTVVICSDRDKPGRQMVEALNAYFDDKQVRVVEWDQRLHGKDITEVYQKEGEDFTRELVLQARLLVREDLEDYGTDDAVNRVVACARGFYDKGYDVGIGPVTNRHFRLTSTGGLIIVTGVPGTGKTDFLNFLTMSFLNVRRSHVCYCSFETPDKFRHAGDLTQIWAGGTDLSLLSPEEVAPFTQTVISHITHIRMRRESPTPEAVLRKTEKVLALHPSLEYLVIDPYLFLSVTTGKNITETDAIKTMLVTLPDWAHDHRIWIFLVAHPRKLKKEDGTSELEEIDMYTIAGSANWANVADFVLSLKRVVKGSSDYTRLSVLKVRDQKICTPGDVFYNRQPCGRYDERDSEVQAQAGTGAQGVLPWEVF